MHKHWIQAAVVLLLVPSCDNLPTISSEPISDGEAASMVAASLGGNSSTSGITGQVTDFTTIASGGVPEIPSGPVPGYHGVDFDTIIVRTFTGLNRSYTYTFYIGYNFSNLGNQLDVVYAMRGVYQTPRMSSDDSVTASMTISHILDSSATFGVNSSYLRLGSQVFTLSNVSVTSGLTITLVDLEVSKTTRVIQSGTGTFSLTVLGSNGRRFTRTGTITFNGGQRATLSMNGQSYTVDLDGGEVI